MALGVVRFVVKRSEELWVVSYAHGGVDDDVVEAHAVHVVAQQAAF